MAKRRRKKETKAFHEFIEGQYKKRRVIIPKRIMPPPKPEPKIEGTKRVIKREKTNPGQTLNDRGYRLTKDGKLEHRQVYKAAYGPIPKDWVVHHIDECKTNNKPENLIALPQPIHHLLHKAMWASGSSPWTKYRQFKFIRKRFKKLNLTSSRPLSC